ncbi:hypothetical protein [Gemmobacter denitrificans]|uniref:Lipoprotein n=1 Tax=Gemmobacter denitrificans TaxID=3123040 RepID=A0ABU8BTV0_9RHOB
MRIAVTLAAAGLLLLSACGGGPIQPNVASMNVSKDGHMVSGRYNAQGFSESEIKTLAAKMCGGSITSFGLKDSDDGIGFAAKCAGQSPYGGFAGSTFYRKENGTAEGYITYSNNGNLAQEKTVIKL